MKLPNTVATLFQSIKWGEWSLLCLYLSLISGIIVGLHYNLHEPFYSTSALDILVPYGSWFRSLHFWTSQLFFLFTVIHFLAVFNSSQHYDTLTYVSLILSLPIILLLLFTGYVLRFDTTGFSAGMIAEHILNSVPIVGSLFNRLLFSISENGLQRVYLHHVCSFDGLFLILTWNHLRRYYRINFTNQLPFIAAVLLICLYVSAPLDPDKPGISYITGPWFFLGLQELLRYLPPLFAGVIFPFSLIGVLALLRNRNRLFGSLLIFIGCWLSVYLILSLCALFLHE